jgi:hypothetical protein
MQHFWIVTQEKGTKQHRCRGTCNVRYMQWEQGALAADTTFLNFSKDHASAVRLRENGVALFQSCTFLFNNVESSKEAAVQGLNGPALFAGRFSVAWLVDCTFQVGRALVIASVSPSSAPCRARKK